MFQRCRLAEICVTALVTDRQVHLLIPAEGKIIRLIQRIPTRIFDKSTKGWLIPLDDNARIALDFIQNKLKVPIHFFGLPFADALRSRLAEIEAIASNNLAPVKSSLPLYHYQKEGVAFTTAACKTFGGVLNACDVGLGKTLMSFGLFENLPHHNILIVVPKSSLYQWQEELLTWQNLPSTVLDGPPETRKALMKTREQIVIVSYEVLRIDIQVLSGIKWSIVIADEAHRLGNIATKLYKAISGLQTDYRLTLTATPIMNRLTELYGIINWISPYYLGVFTKFKERYCVENYWGAVVGGKNLDELKDRIAPLVFRRTAEEAQLELPPTVYQKLPVVLSKKERQLYKNIVKELFFEIEQAELSKLKSPIILQNTLVKMGKLIELCDSMELLGQSTESSKMDALKDHLSDIIDSRKVIIFSRFKRMNNILSRELNTYNPVVINGDVSSKDRALAMAKFKNDPTCRILIGSDAAGSGLNLQVASVVYNYDLPWSVGKLLQRTGRAMRIGQQNSVLVVNLVATNTVEEATEKLLLSKISLAREMIDRSDVYTTLDQVKDVLSSKGR